MWVYVIVNGRESHVQEWVERQVGGSGPEEPWVILQSDSTIIAIIQETQ